MAEEDMLSGAIKRKRESELPRDLASLPAGDSGSGFCGPILEGAELMQLALTSEEVKKFDVDGFVATAAPVLTQRQLEALRADLDTLVDQEHPHPKLDLLHELHYNEAEGSGQVLFHCLGHWRCTASLHDLAFLDAICLPASQLLQGRVVRFWHDQAFVKPGGGGACVQWHQDYSCMPAKRHERETGLAHHSPCTLPRLPCGLIDASSSPVLADWDRTGPMAHLTVHIALDDQTIENGALHWVPGSHKWTRDGAPLPQAAALAREKMERAKASRGASDDIAGASFTTDMEALYEQVLNDAERAQWARRPPETVLLKAGHAAFHHALSVHGSWGNRSSAPRRALVLNYFAHGTRGLMDGNLLKGAPAVQSGEVLQGKFHPVVFDTRRVDMSALPVASV